MARAHAVLDPEAKSLFRHHDATPASTGVLGTRQPLELIKGQSPIYLRSPRNGSNLVEN